MNERFGGKLLDSWITKFRGEAAQMVQPFNFLLHDFRVVGFRHGLAAQANSQVVDVFGLDGEFGVRFFHLRDAGVVQPDDAW